VYRIIHPLYSGVQPKIAEVNGYHLKEKLTSGLLENRIPTKNVFLNIFKDSQLCYQNKNINVCKNEHFY
jgi:hypothetical protein